MLYTYAHLICSLYIVKNKIVKVGSWNVNTGMEIHFVCSMSQCLQFCVVQFLKMNLLTGDIFVWVEDYNNFSGDIFVWVEDYNNFRKKFTIKTWNDLLSRYRNSLLANNVTTNFKF